jgi:hypothetical protein
MAPPKWLPSLLTGPLLWTQAATPQWARRQLAGFPRNGKLRVAAPLKPLGQEFETVDHLVDDLALGMEAEPDRIERGVAATEARLSMSFVVLNRGSV